MRGYAVQMAVHGAACTRCIGGQCEQCAKLARLPDQRPQHPTERDRAACIQCRKHSRRQTAVRRIADHAKHAERKVSFGSDFCHAATFEIDGCASGLLPERLFLGRSGDDPPDIEQLSRARSAEHSAQSRIGLPHAPVVQHGLRHDDIAGPE